MRVSSIFVASVFLLPWCSHGTDPRDQRLTERAREPPAGAFESSGCVASKATADGGMLYVGSGDASTPAHTHSLRTRGSSAEWRQVRSSVLLGPTQDEGQSAGGSRGWALPSPRPSSRPMAPCSLSVVWSDDANARSTRTVVRWRGSSTWEPRRREARRGWRGTASRPTTPRSSGFTR
jgi:hypothetical protein